MEQDEQLITRHGLEWVYVCVCGFVAFADVSCIICDDAITCCMSYDRTTNTGK